MEYEWLHSGLEGASRNLRTIPEQHRVMPPAPLGQAPAPPATHALEADQGSVASDLNSMAGDEAGAALSGSPDLKCGEDDNEWVDIESEEEDHCASQSRSPSPGKQYRSPPRDIEFQQSRTPSGRKK